LPQGLKSYVIPVRLVRLARPASKQGNRLKAKDFLQKVKLICGNESCKEFTELRAVIDGKAGY
jgi:hypothetical protein